MKEKEFINNAKKETNKIIKALFRLESGKHNLNVLLKLIELRKNLIEYLSTCDSITDDMRVFLEQLNQVSACRDEVVAFIREKEFDGFIKDRKESQKRLDERLERLKK